MPGHPQSQLYRQLRDVDPRDYHRTIRMYEEKEAEIGRLEVFEYFELTVHYANALFATGAYRQHLLMVDLVINACIRHNITTVEGVDGDVFQHLLFTKGASAYRLGHHTTASHVIGELIRIDPYRALPFRFLRTILFSQQKKTLQAGRAIFLLCMLLTAAIITLDLLFIRHFYPQFTPGYQVASAAVFVGGLVLLALAYGLAFVRAQRRATQFRAAAKKKG